MSKIDGDSRRRVFRIVGDSEENAIYLLTLDADEMFWCSCNIIIWYYLWQWDISDSYSYCKV